jgi:putative FmdB family regulatory protein
MMPIYEFHCHGCGETTEEFRHRVGDFREPQCPMCAGKTEHIASAPAVHIWNASRVFKNVTQEGDGSRTFETQHEYKQHLAENHSVEVSTAAPKKRKLSHKVVGTWR